MLGVINNLESDELDLDGVMGNITEEHQKKYSLGDEMISREEMFYSNLLREILDQEERDKFVPSSLLTFDKTMRLLRLDPHFHNDRQKLYRLCFHRKLEYIKRGKQSFFTKSAIEQYLKDQTVRR